MNIKILSQQDEIFPDTVQRRVSSALLGQPALSPSVPLEAVYIVLLSGLLGLQELVCYVWGILDQGYQH